MRAATSALPEPHVAQPGGRPSPAADAATQRARPDQLRPTRVVREIAAQRDRLRDRDAIERPATPGVTPAIAVEPVTQEPEEPDQLVALAPLTVDVWNAEERYFAVSGVTPDLILASAAASIPSDPTGAARHGMAYAGPTVWEHLPSYVIDPSTGSCAMTGVASTTRYQATVPQWTSPSEVPPELLAWWQAVLEHIRQHEGEHIRIFEAFVSILPDRVTGQPCSSWEAIVTGWSADVASAQAAFDAVEAGWGVPTYTGPLDW